MAPADETPSGGVAFPADAEGRRSTSAFGRRVLADAMRPVSESAAAAVEAETDWRRRYPRHVARSVELGATDPAAALAIARAGLESIRTGMVFERDGETRLLADSLDGAPRYQHLDTAVVTGSSRPAGELVVPYRGGHLCGDALRRQVNRWVDATVVDPSVAVAFGEVLDHPDWLDLSDRTFAVLGAGAELGPLKPLLAWGATVAAVDVPRTDVWTRILATAEAGAGRVLVPVRARAGGSDGGADLARRAGADLCADTPELADWLVALDGPVCLGSYAYADGEAHLRVAAAMDALAAHLADTRPGDLTLAHLLTPTDAYALAEATAEIARARWVGRPWPLRAMQAPLRVASRGRLFAPAVDTLVGSGSGRRVGVADLLVVQQGPNYALAKRLQRWRAIVARDAGVRVSANVAPASRTRSVTKNRALALTYRGAHRFGIEVFEPATANVLMAALLVRDLRSSTTPADPATALAHPDDLFTDGAVHCGLWTSPYRARSALPFAAVVGVVNPR